VNERRPDGRRSSFSGKVGASYSSAVGRPTM
jgi:hypothetical protein